MFGTWLIFATKKHLLFAIKLFTVKKQRPCNQAQLIGSTTQEVKF